MRNGDQKEQFEAGATRDDSTGKGRPSLISPVLIHRIAVHLAAGEEHYGKDNWTKGMPYCRTADSLVRHIYQWLAQDDLEDHLAAIVCNAMFLMHYEEDHKHNLSGSINGRPSPLDDRPEAFKKILPSLLTPPPPEDTLKVIEGIAPPKQGPWRECQCGKLISLERPWCLECENRRGD